MQRHRRDQLGLGQQFAAGAGHPAAAGARHVGAVAVLERQHEALALVVVDQRRPRPAKARRAPEAGAALRRRPEILGEGHAAARAMGRGDEAEARPAGNTERTGLGDDFVTAEAQRRQDRIEQPPPRRRAPFPQHHRPIEPGKCVGKRATPTRRPAFALHTAGDTRSPPGLRPHDLAPAARARGAPMGRPGFPQARDRQPCRRAARRRAPHASRWRSISAATATRSRPRWARAASLAPWCARTSALGFARTAQGPAVVADEEALPFAPRSLRPRAERNEPALGERPAGHADPDRAHPEAGRAVPRRHAGRRHAVAAAPGAEPRPKARSRAGSARASRPSPTCAMRRACCNVPASPCRWPTARRSTSNIQAPLP